MIKIPPTIDIGSVTYDIIWVDELPGHLVAQIHFRDSVIELVNNLSSEVTFQSFIHECQHGVFISQNYDLHERIYHSDNLVERMSQMWAQIFKQIMKYNLENQDITSININFK